MRGRCMGGGWEKSDRNFLRCTTPTAAATPWLGLTGEALVEKFAERLDLAPIPPNRWGCDKCHGQLTGRFFSLTPIRKWTVCSMRACPWP
jgi:hypothetical protein